MVVNPFEFLGVEPNASEQEIKSAYRKRLKQLHPDKHVGAPEHIVSQLADFTRQLNEAYVDLTQNLERYRREFLQSETRPANRPNPFGLSKSTVNRLATTQVTKDYLTRLSREISFPVSTTNIALTALRMRSLTLRNQSVREEHSLQFALMFILGARVAQSILGEIQGETEDVLELEYQESQSYIQGATDDAQYFLEVNDSDIESFVDGLPATMRAWILEESVNASNQKIDTQRTLLRFFASGMTFVALQA